MNSARNVKSILKNDTNSVNCSFVLMMLNLEGRWIRPDMIKVRNSSEHKRIVISTLHCVRSVDWVSLRATAIKCALSFREAFYVTCLSEFWETAKSHVSHVQGPLCAFDSGKVPYYFIFLSLECLAHMAGRVIYKPTFSGLQSSRGRFDNSLFF